MTISDSRYDHALVIAEELGFIAMLGEDRVREVLERNRHLIFHGAAQPDRKSIETILEVYGPPATQSIDYSPAPS